ncbi:MAG: glycogen synthase GlgA [Acidobacteria bacterium]|nr:glycogen synthase GlgA [Acidobacteriota bacterium]
MVRPNSGAPLRVLFAASEGVPFSKTGGLADVIGALPQALAARGVEVAVVLPRHRSTPSEKFRELASGVTVTLGSHQHSLRILEAPRRALKSGSVRWIFVDYPPYFDRESLYVGAGGKDYPDNPERFSLFSRAVLEVAKSIFPADVIHCHDWQAGLVPVLLRTDYVDDPELSHTRTLLTIHNLAYQGLFPPDALLRAGLSLDLFRIDGLEFFGGVSFLKGALIYADSISTVSPTYASEIQTPEFGCGLDGVLAARAGQLHGILNGADYKEWDPARDRLIAAKYGAKNLSGKAECKRDLLREFEFPETDVHAPLIGIVSRLTRQKGADLIAEVAPLLMKENLRLAVLGTGEPEYEELFRTLARDYPDRVGVRIRYDDALAHKVEAGADMFLMPSHYEPCGLNQIYSLRYGTVPVVRDIGGLSDTVEDYDPATGEGTGFRFTKYTGTAMLEAVRRALSLFRNPEGWKQIMLNGMKKDFSWARSAEAYETLYREM